MALSNHAVYQWFYESYDVKQIYIFLFLQAFACLKVETCRRVPVCFVEDTPDLGHESLSDCTLWNLLLLGLQVKPELTRKIMHCFFLCLACSLANKAVCKNRVDSH